MLAIYDNINGSKSNNNEMQTIKNIKKTLTISCYIYLLTYAIFIWILQILRKMGFIEGVLVFCNTLYYSKYIKQKSLVCHKKSM